MDFPDRRGLRVSDAEREEHALRLRDAAAEGRLTPDELDERLEAAFTARFDYELASLIADLPRPKPPPAKVEPTPRRRISPALAIHSIVVTVLLVGIIGSWVATGLLFLWPLFPLFWVSMSLAGHSAARRGRPSDSGHGWHRPGWQ